MTREKNIRVLALVTDAYGGTGGIAQYHRDFLECIRSRKKPICDVEIGARTVTVCHLANISYLNHAHLKWDPAKEQFVDGKGDAKWLDVVHRDPWSIKV